MSRIDNGTIVSSETKKGIRLQGAAGHYTPETLRLLTSWGGNVVRTYETVGLGAVLDMARAAGVHVIAGLGLNKGTMGPEAVQKAVDTVARFKHHPSVLMWALGNEIEACGDLDATFALVKKTAAAVRREDPTRVITNVFIDFGSDPAGEIRKHLTAAQTHLDCFGFNSYTGATTLADRYFLEKPFWLGELGWMPAFLGRRSTFSAHCTHEWSSTAKAAHYEAALASLAQSSRCLGALVFRWDYATPYPSDTWHCIFLPNTLERTAVGDVLLRHWKGPLRKEDPAPVIVSKTTYEHAGTSGKVYTETAQTGIAKVPASGMVAPGQQVTARLDVVPPKDVTYTWRVQRHNAVDKTAWPPCTRGDDVPLPWTNSFVSKPKVTATYETSNPEVSFTPARPGHYRLYVTAIAGQTAAYASWPFSVRGRET